MYDLVIRGATVVDGTGGPARPADVAVRTGQIAEIGRGLRGTRIVEADGLVLAPGFIDIHSHADFSLPLTPEAPSQLAQGVTTLVTGNCGFSPFPVTALNHDRIGLPGSTDTFVPEWSDLAGFATFVDARRPAVNLALQVGHNTLRAAVMGEDDREPDDDELRRMRAAVGTAAAQGAYGFSTGLVYPPGVFAPRAEVVALVSAAADEGLLYSTHMRNERADVLAAVDEAIDAARQAGARLEISHLKGMGPAAAGLAKEALARLHAARSEGVDVACDVYPYTASSTSLSSLIPPWALDGGSEALARRFAEPGSRRRIVAELGERFAREADPEGIVLAELGPGPYAERAGQSIATIARADGTSPAEALVAVLEGQGQVSIVNHAIDEGDMRYVLGDRLSSVGSDGWVMGLDGPGVPHPRSFGTFARVLGSYVRELGLLTIEEAVRKMTEQPASRVGLVDRGRIAPGLAADLVLFDPATVRDTATYEHPWQAAAGVHLVVVNGDVAYDDGGVTGVRTGRVLRRR